MYYLQFLDNEGSPLCYLDYDHKEEIPNEKEPFGIEVGFTDACYIKNPTYNFLKRSRVEWEDLARAKRTIETAYNEHWDVGDARIMLGREKALFPSSYYGKDDLIFDCASFYSTVLCALWYLLMRKYRIQRCKHCGRLYITKSRNSKFCSRNSQMAGYEAYTCAEAVHQAKDTLAKEAKNFYNAKYSSGHYVNALNDFLKGLAERKEAVRDSPSYENFFAYRKFLKDEKARFDGLMKARERCST